MSLGVEIAGGAAVLGVAAFLARYLWKELGELEKLRRP